MKILLSIAVSIMILVCFSCNKPQDPVPDTPFVVEPSGTVYIGCNYYNPTNCYIYAVDAATGAVKWRVYNVRGTTSTATMAKGKLYFMSGFDLGSIDTASRNYKLEYSTNSQHHGSLLLYNNVIYYNDDYRDFGFDINTNTNVISVSTGGGGDYSGPTAANGILYSAKSIIYAINIATGAIVWSRNVGANTYSNPAVSNGIVYVGSYQPTLYALDAFTGIDKWTFKLNNVLNSPVQVASSPTVYNGVVYFGATDSIFYALNALTGEMLWKKKIANTIIHSDPIVINNTVFFTSIDFFALNATTGELKWKTVLPSVALYESPVYANGVVYIGCSNGKLVALDANTGSILWNTTLGNGFFGGVNPMLVDKNGIVYHPGNSGEQN